MKIPTGIVGLDKILGGGLEENMTLLIMGPPGTGKTTFCQKFIYSGLAQNQSALYITLDSSPEDIVVTMKNFNWDVIPFIERSEMVFLDAYSWRLGGAQEEPWKRVVQGGLDINALNLTVTEILNTFKSENKRIVFDSLSTLLLYIPASLVVKFIPILIAKGKQMKAAQILVLEEGVHDQQTVNTLNFLTDGLIETKIEGDKRYLRVSRIKGIPCPRDWVEFDITT